MSLSAAAMRLLAEKGLTFDEIVAVAAANEGDAPVSKGAMRQRKYREKRQAEASQSVTKASPNVTPITTDERHQSVTKRHISSPLARVEDKPLRLEVTGKLSLSLVRERAGDALASMATHPGVATIAPLTSLLEGAEPCQPDEVYDGIEKAAAWYRAKRPPGSMSNWDLARKMALEIRDQRLTGTPAPKAPHERPDTPSARRNAREDNLSRGFAAAMAVAGSRAHG